MLKIDLLTDEELLKEHEFYKELCRTMPSGKATSCIGDVAQIEVELDYRNIPHSKFVIYDFGDTDWFKKLVDRTQGYDHIIIDPKGETKLIGQLIRNSIQNGRDPSRIVLHLPNGDALQLSDLDDEKAVEVLNAMFGLEMTAEEYSSDGEYAKYFSMGESSIIYDSIMMIQKRKHNPKNQVKTTNPPFYQQFEKKRF